MRTSPTRCHAVFSSLSDGPYNPHRWLCYLLRFRPSCYSRARLVPASHALHLRCPCTGGTHSARPLFAAFPPSLAVLSVVTACFSLQHSITTSTARHLSQTFSNIVHSLPTWYLGRPHRRAITASLSSHHQQTLVNTLTYDTTTPRHSEDSRLRYGRLLTIRSDLHPQSRPLRHAQNIFFACV